MEIDAKEAAYLRQCVDCSCNDCIFLERSKERLNASKDFHRQLDQDLFNTAWKNLTKKAMKARRFGDLEKFDAILTERDKMKFQASYDAGLLFGRCKKKDVDISFMPNVFSLENQDCFLHRKDAPPEMLPSNKPKS